MDYCTTCFNKTLANLEYQDIENFFHEPREESTRLEFKSFPQKGDFNKCLEGVIIGICAFLNSEGGILIWGGSCWDSNPRAAHKNISRTPFSFI